MEYKDIIIISDIDGTILPAGQEYISNENVEFAKKFMKEGGIFVLCSGRTRSSLAKYENQIEPTFVSYANGAELYNKQLHKIEYQLDVSKSVVDEILELFKNNDQISISANSDKMIHLIKPTDAIIKYYKVADIPFLVTEEFPEHILKINVSGIKYTEIEIILKNHFKDSFSITPVGPINIDVANKSSSKAKTLECMKLLFPCRTVITLGDYHNDKDMMKMADFPCAPNDAIDEIKNISHVLKRKCSENIIPEVLEFIDKL